MRRFADRAQFIIVTHQKRTMDAADVLYGVSMGSGGVTKVISRRFEQDQPALDEAPRPPDLATAPPIVGRARRPAPPWHEEASSRLRESLRRSREALSAEITSSLFDKLDAEAFERIEEALIIADVGAPATAEVVGRLEHEVESGAVSEGDAARERLVELLAECLAEPALRLERRPGPGRGHGRRRQRHRQDDDDRQAARSCASAGSA